MAVFEKALTRFFDLALGTPQRTTRDRPLLAMPLLGARHGGAAPTRARHAEQLLALVHELVAARDESFDLVIVTWTPELFAWCQQVRRRLEPKGGTLLSSELVRQAEQLGRRAAEGKLVLFVGAGVSAGVGLPTWSDLLTKIEKKKLDAAQRSAVAGLGPLDRAAVLASVLEGRRKNVGDLVAAELKHAKTPGLQHALLASLPVTEMATTNYDQLLEAAVEAAHDELAVIPYRHAQNADRWLLKLHGDIDETGSIVLTRDDYLAYTEQRGALRGVVQALLLTRHMLFVGFSMTDDNFARIAHDVRRVTAMATKDVKAELGTVLSILDDEARKLMWGKDLTTVAMAQPLPAGASDEEQKAHFAAAVRQHEIFLDRVLLEASPASLHILDPTFATALGEPDVAAKKALAQLVDAAERFGPDASPAWQQLHELLDRLGAQAGREGTGRVRRSDSPAGQR